MKKNDVEKLIDGFVLNIAELYEPVIVANVDEDLFEEMVIKILESKDKLIKSILEIQVEEPVSELPESPGNRGEEAIIKTDIPLPEPVRDLWNGGVDLPRDVGTADILSENISGDNVRELVEATTTALAAPISSSAGFVDEDTNVNSNHDLGLSVAQESRLANGIPLKTNKPHIIVDHTGAREVAATPPRIPRPVPGASIKTSNIAKEDLITEETKNILRRLQDVCMPYQTSQFKPLQEWACSISSIVATYLPQDSPYEAPRYESSKALWLALQNILTILKRVQEELGKYTDLGKLQKDIDSIITQLIVETAQYSLPDEAPVEEDPTLPPEMEKEDGK